MNFIILFLSLFISFNAHAFCKDEKTIRIIIHSLDTCIEGKDVKIEYYQHYSQLGNWPVSNQVLRSIHNSSLDVKLKVANRMGYLKMTLPKPYFDKIINTVFLSEADDLIMLELKNGNVAFLGKDSNKYIFQNIITELQSEAVTYKGPLDSIYYREFFAKCDDVMNKKLMLLRKHKKEFSTDFFNICNLNIKSENKTLKLVILCNFSGSTDNEIIESTRSAYTEYLKNLTNNDIDNAEIFNSSSFFDYLFLKEIADLSIYSDNSKADNRYRFSELFSNILRKYKGVIRDRLVLSSIIGNLSVRDSTDFYRNTALGLVKDPYVYDILLSQTDILGKGAKAFDFTLLDTTGALISLHDFTGKLVIVDYYFTGCSGCIDLSLGMTGIVSKYKDNPQVVFISINLDGTMEKFKLAVRSGKYTHDGYINLFTNGKGTDHELVRYYGIRAYPFLMIIDKKGNILSGNPPYPYNNRTELANGFIRIINDELLYN